MAHRPIRLPDIVQRNTKGYLMVDGLFVFGKRALFTARATHDPVGVPAKMPDTLALETLPLAPMATRTIAMPGTRNLSRQALIRPLIRPMPETIWLRPSLSGKFDAGAAAGFFGAGAARRAGRRFLPPPIAPSRRSSSSSCFFLVPRFLRAVLGATEAIRVGVLARCVPL